jgi:hypothetical protein
MSPIVVPNHLAWIESAPDARTFESVSGVLTFA